MASKACGRSGVLVFDAEQTRRRLGWVLLLWGLNAVIGMAWAAAPNPPTNATATITTPTSVTVTFYAPGSGTAEINAYTVTSSPGSKTCSPIPPLPGASSPASCVVTGLTPGMSYTFTATSSGPGGTSAPSSPTTSVTPDYQLPNPPTNLTATPGNGAVALSFVAPVNDGNGGDAPIQTYTVSTIPATGSCQVPGPSYGATLGCTVTGLTNGTAYTFTASSKNNQQTTSTSNPRVTASPSAQLPPFPEGVTALASNGSAIVSWLPVVWSHIDSYTVTSSPGGSTCTANAATLTVQPPTTCTVTGLTNGTSYTFTVVTNGAGGNNSLNSPPSAPVTPSNQVPSAPANVAATAGNGTAKVTWSPLNPAPTGYSVQAWSVSPTQGGGYSAPVATGISCTPSPVSATQCTFPSGTLTVGLNYEFTVTATNAYGVSQNSGYSSPVQINGSVTFTLADKTNLSNNYQIYVTGFSTAGTGSVLTTDGSGNGSFGAFSNESGTLPCYQYPQQINNISISNTQTDISARVYYFVVSNTSTYTQPCSPTTGNGLFGQLSAFTYTKSGTKVSTPDPSLVINGSLPAWTFSEIGASSTNATMDLSQVDFFAFPMHTNAQVTSGPSEIGNPVESDIVNNPSVYDNYRQYFNGLAQQANSGQDCTQDSTPVACAFLDLLQAIPNSPGASHIIQNPGGYLGMVSNGSQAHASSPLNTLFDGVITDIWSGTVGSLELDSGGSLGGVGKDAATNGVPEDVFTSTAMTMNYPNGHNEGTTTQVQALKFTGTSKSNNYVVYVFDPTDVATACASGLLTYVNSQSNKVNIPICGDAWSGGYQVFAGAGVLRTPSCEQYNALVNGGLIQGSPVSDCSNSGSSVDLANYQAVAGRMGFLISTALNRGVAAVGCTGDTWTCWQDETQWYPTDTKNQYTSNATVQNLFSRWIHTAAISGNPLFVQPPNSVKSAGGKLMGMAYGFSNDENPTPPVDSNNPQPEVPSKFDSTVVYGGTGNTITFGPWTTSPDQPTLTVSLQGQGTVTSSPAGINCGPTCSQAFASGAQVVLRAAPSSGYVFSGWTGACTGSSPSCTVYMNSAQTVTAQFTPHATGNESLTVHVTGNGTVAGGGIACDPTCSVAETTGSTVVLTATADTGAVFSGWGGACRGTTPSCRVSMSQAQTVQASFTSSDQYNLKVSSSSGGTVSSSPPGIDCGTVCQAPFSVGASVTLTAQPATGYVFAGWNGGGCTGTGACQVTMNSKATVIAAFTATPRQKYALTVQNSGSGTVTSNPQGIDCGTACSQAFTAGTSVTLSATPAANYTFKGWTGGCAGSGACVISMDQVESVGATFTSDTPPTYGVSGSVTAPGGGTVTLALTPAVGNSGSPKQTVVQTLPAGAYTFPDVSNGTYTLSIVGLSSQTLSCSFANGTITAPSITIKDNASTGNSVSCVSGNKGYSVGGAVTGLDSGKTVTLINNGGNRQGGSSVSVSNPGPQQFLFGTQVANNSAYAVTVKSNPPGQTCQPTQNAKGTAAAHGNSLQVTVACQATPAAFSVGGTVTGLPAGYSVTLQDNGGDNLPVNGMGTGSASIPFTFATAVNNGANYNVTVGQQPNGYTCNVTNGSGTVSGGAVTSVSVVCTQSMFQISGVVNGLTGTQSATVAEGSNPPQTLTALNVGYAFTGLADGSPYQLTLTSPTAQCQFTGPDAPSGIIKRNLTINLTCNRSATNALSVQNASPFKPFLLSRNQAAVVQMNGGQTATVWGGATGATTLGAFNKGLTYNVQAVGQSQSMSCGGFDASQDPGTLNASTTLNFNCTNVGPGASPGSCAGLYSNQNTQSMPPSSLAVQNLCAQGFTSGPIHLSDGRWKWRCSGSGNPKVYKPAGAGPQWQGTATCYSASYSTPNPGKQNQAPLWVSASAYGFTAGGSQTFTVNGGSGTGDLAVPVVESVGNAVCAVQSRVNNPGWRVVANKAPGTQGNGACVVWVRKMGDSTYYDVEGSPTVFNVTGQ